MTNSRNRPEIFIGSSTEAIQIARFLRKSLQKIGEVHIWSKGVFGLGRNTLDELIRMSRQVDFAVFVFSADDKVITRHKGYASARDNVIFELGLFIGAIGNIEPIFCVKKSILLSSPAIWLALRMSSYSNSSPENLEADIDTVSLDIEQSIVRAQLEEPSPRKLHYMFLKDLVSRFPQGLREDDLGMFVDNGLSHQEYIELRGLLQQKKNSGNFSTP